MTGVGTTTDPPTRGRKRIHSAGAGFSAEHGAADRGSVPRATRPPALSAYARTSRSSRSPRSRRVPPTSYRRESAAFPGRRRSATTRTSQRTVTATSRRHEMQLAARRIRWMCLLCACALADQRVDTARNDTQTGSTSPSLPHTSSPARRFLTGNSTRTANGNRRHFTASSTWQPRVRRPTFLWPFLLVILLRVGKSP